MKTKLLLIGAGAALLLMVEVGYSLALQPYATSASQSFFRGPFSTLLMGARQSPG